MEIAKIKKTISPAEIKYLKNSLVYAPNDLDQSQVNINTSMNENSVDIQQSAVNIDLWKIKLPLS